MTRTRKYLLATTGLVVLVILQQAGVFWTPPPGAAALRGVVESTDSQELPDDIFVIATWRAQTGMSSSHCVHMEVTKTDSEGNWSFPMWQDWRHNRRAVLFIEVYSPGQIAVAEGVIQNRWQIAKRERSRLAYLNYLGRLRVYCGAVDGSRVNAVEVWNQILHDILGLKNNAKALPETDLRQIDSLGWEFAKRVVDPTFRLSGDARNHGAENLINSIEESMK